MRAQRAADLGVRNLELLFTPLGLPFVQATESESGAASLLVRGGAGTGKTTLAVALGHAAGRHGKGSALVLTTERGAVDVSFKASLLGLADAIVRPWETRADAPVESIFVHTLPPPASPATRATPLERARLAMKTAQDLLADPGAMEAPVRAIVIDAIEPPASSDDASALRLELESFVEALAEKSISAVFIEEAGPAGAELLAFVVDVVFSLDFRADPDSGELQRELSCMKSRFSRALPGPHAYGLDPETQRPIVWPDLLAVVAADREVPLAVPKARQARMLVPIASDGEHMVLQGGSVVINQSDRTGTTFVDALRFTPGVRVVEWRCGPLTSVATKQKRVEISASAGPHALGDMVVRALRDASANTVVVHGMETLLERGRAYAPLLRVVEALRALGVLTCLHGKMKSLRRLEPMADVIVDDSRRGGLKRLAEPRYRPATLWLLDLTRPDLFAWKRGELSPHSLDEAQHVVRVQGALAKSHEGVRQGDAQAALDALRTAPRDPRQFPGWSEPIAAACFVAALARFRAGAEDVNPLDGYLSPDELADDNPVALDEMPLELRAPLAWTYALMGRDGEAARACYEACDGEVPGAHALLSLWWSLNAVHAQSNAAIEALAILRGKPEGRFTLGFHLRALARRGRLDEVDAVIDGSRDAYNLKDYMVTRLQAEARLDAGETAMLTEAKTRLTNLASGADLPPLHRAEISYNLGFTHEKLGENDEAVRWYRRSLTANGRLSVASRALTRLGEADTIEDAKSSPEAQLSLQTRG